MVRLFAMMAWIALAQMALAGAGSFLAQAFGEERHVCVCPIDANGHCRCFDCIRLDVHGDRDGHDHDEPDAAPDAPVWTSGCTAGPDAPLLATFDPFVSPPAVAGAAPPSLVATSLSPPVGMPPDPDLPRVDRPPRAA